MTNRHVVVVGAGIVGIACASYLQRAGFRVTVIDYRAPGEGCSFGNAGIIASGACLPMAMPGIWKQIPKFLVDPLGPLSIRLRYAPLIVPWLVRWLQSSSVERVTSTSRAMRELYGKAFEAYAPLLEAAGRSDLIKHSGQITVSTRPRGALGSPLSRRLFEEAGVETVELGPDDLRALEPTLSPELKSGLLFPEHGHSLDPFKVVQCLAEQFVRQGGTITRGEVIGFSHDDGRPVAVRTSSETISSDVIVVAAGAWSNQLTSMLGTKIPLVAERGYHVMLPRPGQMPTRPVSSVDHRFAITPMQDGLRFAGMVEIDTASAPMTTGRADVLLRIGQILIPGVDIGGATSWMGPRPAMPDGLPVIGRSPRHRSVFFAFGHGHYGLTGAAVTGRLITDLVLGRTPFIAPEPYSAERFS
jgi:D-amino-acid dehydrogenase